MNKCPTTETVAAESISPAGSTLLWASGRVTTSRCPFLRRTWGTFPWHTTRCAKHETPACDGDAAVTWAAVTPALSLAPGKELCVEMFWGTSYTKHTSRCLGSKPDKPAILPCQNADELWWCRSPASLSFSWPQFTLYCTSLQRNHGIGTHQPPQNHWVPPMTSYKMWQIHLLVQTSKAPPLQTKCTSPPGQACYGCLIPSSCLWHLQPFQLEVWSLPVLLVCYSGAQEKHHRLLLHTKDKGCNIA